MQRSLELDVFPELGQLPITDIDSPLLLKCLERIQKRNALETTKRIRQRCSGIFRFAQIKGLCNEDPAEPLKDVLLSKTKTFSSDSTKGITCPTRSNG